MPQLLPPVPPIGKDGFQDPVWAKWLNALHGTVTQVVASPSSIAISAANGFSGTVSQPAGGEATITLEATTSGILKGNGQQLVPAVAGVDYLVQNETIKVTGDATGNGSVAIVLTLANNATARANLGLASMATQAASNVAVTGGSIALTGAFTPNTILGIHGTVLGDNVQTGGVGEYAEVTESSASTLTSGVALNILTLPLAAGDWDVSGVAAIVGATTSTIIGVTVNTFNKLGSSVQVFGAAGTLATPVVRVNVSTNTNVFLTAQSVFTGTATATGYLRARRVR